MAIVSFLYMFLCGLECTSVAAVTFFFLQRSDMRIQQKSYTKHKGELVITNSSNQ